MNATDKEIVAGLRKSLANLVARKNATPAPSAEQLKKIDDKIRETRDLIADIRAQGTQPA